MAMSWIRARDAPVDLSICATSSSSGRDLLLEHATALLPALLPDLPDAVAEAHFVERIDRVHVPGTRGVEVGANALRVLANGVEMRAQLRQEGGEPALVVGANARRDVRRTLGCQLVEPREPPLHLVPALEELADRSGVRADRGDVRSGGGVVRALRRGVEGDHAGIRVRREALRPVSGGRGP
jgi:hypothetical protein